jgi:hypothetical protein
MSMCICGDPTVEFSSELEERQVIPLSRSGLFNWVTVLLLAVWVGIVTLAIESAGVESMAAAPTLEAFLRTLL